MRIIARELSSLLYAICIFKVLVNGTGLNESTTQASPSPPKEADNVYIIVGVLLLGCMCISGLCYIIIRKRVSARMRVNYIDDDMLLKPRAETVPKTVFSVHKLAWQSHMNSMDTGAPDLINILVAQPPGTTHWRAVFNVQQLTLSHH